MALAPLQVHLLSQYLLRKSFTAALSDAGDQAFRLKNGSTYMALRSMEYVILFP
ncbi:MAG: hypothetical protein J6Y71_08035 [Ruminococcus sp.]|nr:hypothetical protein [Ruminococcus sp.]